MIAINVGMNSDGECYASISRGSMTRLYGYKYAGSRSKCNKPITLSSFDRLHRAQRRLAGLPVSGWPWPDYCKCSMPMVDFWDVTHKHCDNCGKEIKLS